MKPPILPMQRASLTEVAHKMRYQVDVSRGEVQCPYKHRPPVSDSSLACVLREGHPGMHCHAYVTPSPTEHWYTGT